MPHSAGQLCFSHATYGNALAMQHLGRDHGLYGMPNCMAIVQGGSQACFLFVQLHNLGLVRHSLVKHVLEQGIVQSHDALGIGCQLLEQRCIPYDSHLDGLSQALHNLSATQSAQHRGICKDDGGLVKCPDEVFSGWDVDCRLSSNTRVDHCHGRSGNLEDRDASHVSRCCVTRKISDHSTTKSNNCGISSAFVRKHEILNVLFGLAVL
mmetsp:Transcript_9620/g.17271  ORF Transcript_9620/g.17271 Transcript_9620/m.17271 type:complete len:209 (-) Transcript_9620:360-986(-)